jgi:crotonobetainyl-CoA:carnitine CoA-transferase CaiB-like acyl-CoA transferase
VNGVAEALADPQALARAAVVGYDHPVLGEVRTVGTPLRLSTSEPPLDRGPFLGEHTTPILADVCGYSEDRIEELARLGVFGPAENEVAQ